MDVVGQVVVACNAAILIGGTVGLLCRHFRPEVINSTRTIDRYNIDDQFNVSVNVTNNPQVVVSQDTIELLYHTRNGALAKAPVFSGMLRDAELVLNDEVKLNRALQMKEDERSPVQRIAVALFLGA